jgi:hypothetical protein
MRWLHHQGTACPRLQIERSQCPVFMKSFTGDRLSASGQLDTTIPPLLDELPSETRTIWVESNLQKLWVWRIVLSKFRLSTSSSIIRTVEFTRDIPSRALCHALPIKSWDATPTAAPAADQPTSLSSRLLPQFGKDLFDSVTKTRHAALLSARP